MAAHKLCWLAVLGCWLSGNAIADIPSYFSAKSYEFKLTLGQPNNTFSGTAVILLKTNDATDVRSKDLVLSGSGLVPQEAIIEYENKRQVFVTSNEIKLISDTIIIPGKEFLLKNSAYKITINYTGWENQEGGIFSTKYNNSVYYGTKLYPIYSNRVFPCLDLPRNLATIKLTVSAPYAGPTAPRVVSGLFPKKNSTDGKNIIYEFESQAPISVSSIFFTAGLYKDVGEKFHVWTPLYLGQTPKITINALKVPEVGALLNNTALLFPNVSLSAVVVPGLASHSDSGLGLAAFSVELATELSSMQGKRTQAIETLRAIYKSLYVSLLTPRSLQDIWISESISLYLASKTYTKIEGLEAWEGMNLGVVVSALEESWSMDSSPVQRNITDATQVVDYLQSSAVKKGASILAMLGSVLANDVDIEIYNAFCTDYFGTKISSDEFLASYADYAGLNDLPGNKTFVQIVEPWLQKPGYPAIKVGRKENDILAGESVFGPVNKEQDIEWIVPINYMQLTAYQSNELAANGDNFKWMTPSKNADFKLAEKVTNLTTVILNTRGTGLYRTLYDEKDIELLGEVLSVNVGKLDARTRATLLNDLFAFIKTGDLKYSAVLGMLQYLKNEDSLEPWSVAIRGLEELRKLIFFKDSELLEQFNSLIGDYIRYSYLKMPIPSAIFEENPVQRMLSSLSAKWLCNYDDYTCYQQALQAYEDYIVPNKEGSIKNKDIIPVIYCSKLSGVNSNVFKTFMANYSSASSAEDRRNVLSYLACPQDNATINWYLSNFMLNNSTFLAEDIVVAFEELAARLQHLDLCFSFINSNFATLNKKLTTDHKAKLISILGNFGSSDMHLNTLKNFPESNITSIKKAVESALKNVEDRQKFLNDNYLDIQVALYGFDPNPSPTGPTKGPNPPTPSTDTPPTSSTTPKTSSAPISSAAFVSLISVAIIALLMIH